MAYSKTFLLLGLVFAVVLLVSYEISAQETVQTDAVNEDKRGCRPGDKRCCRPGDKRCCYPDGKPCCPHDDHHGKRCHCPCNHGGKKLEESDHGGHGDHGSHGDHGHHHGKK